MKWISLLTALFFSLSAFAKPDLLLAKSYNGDIHIQDYWVSEKLDGVRAYWDGKQLISRQGNVFNAPAWFVQHFPQQALDGELWIGRNQFEATISTVKKQTPVDAQWQRVKYMIFEFPNAKGTFTQRITAMQELVEHTNSPYLNVIEQTRLASLSALDTKLDKVIAKGGEGLMLHHGDSLYQTGRSNALLKVKKQSDAEAIVIKHLAGKGKHAGRLGALLVKMPSGKQFKIGTGFSDAERESPPPIGTTISYKHYGFSKNGIPRFASYWRVRHAE